MLKTSIKWTVLKVYFSVYLICCLVFTITKWKTLSYEEGWGIVGMVGLTTIGIFGLLIDLILSLIIKNKKTLNLIETFLVILFSIELYITL